MLSFNKWIGAVAIGQSLLCSTFGLVAGTDGPSKPASVQQFASLQAEGVIGVTDEAPIDNPADNIFHVQIDAPLCGEEKVWLVYELDGVQDHSAVSRSVNDQVAVGGYLVKERHGWTIQREQLNAAWLKEGDNVVRFTLPQDAARVTQGVLGLRAEGHIHKLPARYIPFVPFAPPQVRAATAVINLGLSGYNHTMHSVMSKMGIK